MTCKRLLASTAIPLIFAGALSASAQEIIDIPSQPLADALSELGHETGLQVLAAAEAVEGQTSVAVRGPMSPQAALARILSDTNLSFREVEGSGAIVAQQAFPMQNAVEDPFELEMIILTGERVETNLLDTETSVTVLTQTDIEQSNAGAVFETAKTAPNVTPVGGEFLPPIRGVNSDGPIGIAGNDLNGTSPRLTLVVDGVSRPISYPNVGSQGLFDVEQIEVLRGPQTTLQGANAIAGSFVVNTKDPVFGREGAIQFNIEDDQFSDVDTRTSLMFNDQLIEDELAYRVVLQYRDGQIPVIYGDPQNDASSDEYATYGRVKLLWEPEDNANLSALFSLEFQDGYDQAFDSSISAKDRTALGGQRTLETRNFGATADIRYQIGAGELRSITSYFDDHYESSPFSTDSSVIFDDVNDERFTQDLVYAFEDLGVISSGLLGFTYQLTKKDQNYGGFLDRQLEGERNTAALFTSLSFDLSNRIELNLGGRLHHERYKEKTRSAFGGGAAGILDYSETYTEFLPSIGLTYQLDPYQSVFATARRGFNSGGSGVNLFDGSIFTFDPEYVDTFELGYRGELADGNVIVTATAFYNVFDGYHAYVFGPGGFIDYAIENIDGTTYGLELETIAQLSETVRGRFGIGLLETEIDAPGEAIDGNGFGDDPDYTLNFGIAWDATPNLTLDAAATYVGKYFNDFNETPGTESGDYWNLDLGLTYEGDRFSVRGYVRNALDELQFVNQSSEGAGSVLDPRTLGVTATWTF